MKTLDIHSSGNFEHGSVRISLKLNRMKRFYYANFSFGVEKGEVSKNNRNNNDNKEAEEKKQGERNNERKLKKGHPRDNEGEISISVSRPLSLRESLELLSPRHRVSSFLFGKSYRFCLSLSLVLHPGYTPLFYYSTQLCSRVTT